MIASSLRTRIAPTPSGYLHIGNLFSFIITWLIAKKNKGTILLRIDDLDAARMRKEYLEDIFRVLEFIGLQPDEGPSGVDDFLKNYSQSLRIEHYRKLLQGLKEAGLLYACNCSRKKIKVENQDGVYPGTCRNLALPFEQHNVALRIKVPGEMVIQVPNAITRETFGISVHNSFGDFVVCRREGLTAYQIASLSDDIYYGINFIVRGKDLLPSTAAQLFLADCLNLKGFSDNSWLHHKLISNPKNEKLSKSAEDTSIQWMIQHGITKSALITMMGALLGLPEKNYRTLDELYNDIVDLNKVLFENSLD